jgi:hypothetical protein
MVLARRLIEHQERAVTPDHRSTTHQDSAAAPAARAGSIAFGGDLIVNRMGFGAMRITGPGIFGPPPDKEEAIRVLRRAVELGVDCIDTADSYGPYVSEELIAEARAIAVDARHSRHVEGAAPRGECRRRRAGARRRGHSHSRISDRVR